MSQLNPLLKEGYFKEKPIFSNWKNYKQILPNGLAQLPE
jgi:hypothetical protein